MVLQHFNCIFLCTFPSLEGWVIGPLFMGPRSLGRNWPVLDGQWGFFYRQSRKDPRGSLCNSFSWMIPHGDGPSRAGNCLNSEYQLIVRSAPKSPGAEAIRSLRTNLQFVGVDRALKSVMVSSAGPAEGKTTIASNLSASLAEAGTKTIIVGADLRKPSVHKVFGCGNQVGLTNVLLGQVSLKDALLDTNIENLRILPSGPIPPNPAELIGSEAMRELTTEIAEMCDFVIYDATPVVAVTDAVLLSRMVDGVLLVVAMNQTPREMLATAKQQLEQVNARILGVVANRVAVGGTSYMYYYYYSSEHEAAATQEESPARQPFLSRLRTRLANRGLTR